MAQVLYLNKAPLGPGLDEAYTSPLTQPLQTLMLD